MRTQELLSVYKTLVEQDEQNEYNEEEIKIAVQIERVINSRDFDLRAWEDFSSQCDKLRLYFYRFNRLKKIWLAKIKKINLDVPQILKIFMHDVDEELNTILLDKIVEKMGETDGVDFEGYCLIYSKIDRGVREQKRKELFKKKTLGNIKKLNLELKELKRFYEKHKEDEIVKGFIFKEMSEQLIER